MLLLFWKPTGAPPEEAELILTTELPALETRLRLGAAQGGGTPAQVELVPELRLVTVLPALQVQLRLVIDDDSLVLLLL